jgi:DNA polymerase-3 subunit alpha
MNFNVSGQDIRFGLLALKNVGRQFINAILAERQRGGNFSSFTNFVERMEGQELNRRQVEALIKSGAFDGLGVYRSRLIASYEKIIDLSLAKNRSNISGQLDMFSQAAQMPVRSFGTDFEYPNIPELTVKEKLAMEKDASGMYFSGHLLDGYSKHIESIEYTPIEAFVSEDADNVDKQAIKTVGIISSVTLKTTKNGERMAFFTLENRYASIECIVFTKKYSRLSQLIKPDLAIAIAGNVSLREDEDVKIIVSAITALIENANFTEPQVKESQKDTAPVKTPSPATQNSAPIRASKVYLKVPDMIGEKFKKVINLIEIFGDGEVDIVLYDDSKKTYSACNVKITASEVLIRELKALLGDANVILK